MWLYLTLQRCLFSFFSSVQLLVFKLLSLHFLCPISVYPSVFDPPKCYLLFVGLIWRTNESGSMYLWALFQLSTEFVWLFSYLTRSICLYLFYTCLKSLLFILSFPITIKTPLFSCLHCHYWFSYCCLWMHVHSSTENNSPSQTSFTIKNHKMCLLHVPFLSMSLFPASSVSH